MRSMAFWFFVTATLYLLAGMVWGIVMSATTDHSLSPAHAHLNLIGGVLMALAGIFYQLVPAANDSRYAKVHFAVATLGILTMIPGIAMAISGQGETLAKIGSVITLAAMAMFAFAVFRFRARS